jgi:hypothetical protein
MVFPSGIPPCFQVRGWDPNRFYLRLVVICLDGGVTVSFNPDFRHADTKGIEIHASTG